MGISLFLGGLNACPDDLGHLFTATTVILQIFSNRSHSTQPGPAPECLVECEGVQSLFGQCPNVGSNNCYGSSLKPEIFLPARLHVELTTHHLPAARSPELFADQEPNNLQSLPCPLCGHKSVQ